MSNLSLSVFKWVFSALTPYNPRCRNSCSLNPNTPHPSSHLDLRILSSSLYFALYSPLIHHPVLDMAPFRLMDFSFDFSFSLFRFLIFCLQRVVLNFLLVTSIDWYVNWMRAEKSKISLPRNALKTKENCGYSYLFVLLVCAIPIISRNCTPLQKEGWIERDAKTDYRNCHRP